MPSQELGRRFHRMHAKKPYSKPQLVAHGGLLAVTAFSF
jgi:hypothetical protein